MIDINHMIKTVLSEKVHCKCKWGKICEESEHVIMYFELSRMRYYKVCRSYHNEWKLLSSYQYNQCIELKDFNEEYFVINEIHES